MQSPPAVAVAVAVAPDNFEHLENHPNLSYRTKPVLKLADYWEHARDDWFMDQVQFYIDAFKNTKQQWMAAKNLLSILKADLIQARARVANYHKNIKCKNYLEIDPLPVDILVMRVEILKKHIENTSTKVQTMRFKMKENETMYNYYFNQQKRAIADYKYQRKLVLNKTVSFPGPWRECGVCLSKRKTWSQYTCGHTNICPTCTKKCIPSDPFTGGSNPPCCPMCRAVF
jgi:hypothetical protein